jgi:hypothetical protein
VALHVALAVGGVAVVALGGTLLALALLVVGKTALDVRAHRVAHRRQRAHGAAVDANGHTAFDIL